MNEQNIYIVRTGEVALKGMNKPYFEKKLVDRISKNLSDLMDIAESSGYSKLTVRRIEGLIFVRSPKEIDSDEVVARIRKVFGVSSISPAVEAESDLDKVGEVAVEYMKGRIEKDGIKTFKVEAKRADKSFPIKSPDIARITGANILKGCKVLKVDVHNPDEIVHVDLRRDKTYIFSEKIKGMGGLPLGTNGRGMVLFSGGIDSPVAAWMMARRGMVIEAVHYHSYPYTSKRAQEKVERLVEILAGYTGKVRLHVVNLLPIQEEVVAGCPEDETTILVRRFMMRVAEKLAEKNHCTMLVTGENLGQVASQTAESLVVTDSTVDMPIMRPLIGMDKVDIMEKAREIGTYKTSIEPFEDCCTVFLPKHPVTKPRLEKIQKSEEVLDIEALVDQVVAAEEIIDIE